MKVNQLKRGTRFRINAHTYTLISRNDCAALVQESGAEDREVTFIDKDGNEKTITRAGNRRYHIGSTSVVDEVYS